MTDQIIQPHAVAAEWFIKYVPEGKAMKDLLQVKLVLVLRLRKS